MNITVQVLCGHMFSVLGFIPRSGIARLGGNFLFHSFEEPPTSVGSKKKQGNSKKKKKIYLLLHSFSSVIQSCLTLCNPMDCSIPGLPVHHQLLEFTQTHVHWVGDAILKPGVAAERSNPTPKEGQLRGCRRAERSYSTFKFRRGSYEEIPLIQGKGQWLRFGGAAVKRYPTSKVRETQVRL